MWRSAKSLIAGEGLCTSEPLSELRRLVHILHLEFWIFACDVLSREPIAQELEGKIHGEAQTPNGRFTVADRGINMNSVEGHGDTVRDFEVSRKSGAEGRIHTLEV